jgi:hypothetical protein
MIVDTAKAFASVFGGLYERYLSDASRTQRRARWTQL